MGAAVGVEMNKPADGSDVCHSLIAARNEVMRLRHTLGHLAKGAGFSDVVFDASDLVHGQDEDTDMLRCVAEVVHIRAALQLATASGKRRERTQYAPKSFFEMAGSDEDVDSSSNSESENEDEDTAETGKGSTSTATENDTLAEEKQQEDARQLECKGPGSASVSTGSSTAASAAGSPRDNDKDKDKIHVEDTLARQLDAGASME